MSWFTAVLQNIDNQKGLYAFIAIAILILVYLIKPKPRERTVPSLIFVMKQIGKAKKQSFFRRLIAEVLFFLHLLLLLLLAIAATQPFFHTNIEQQSENTVLVLDISASMAVKDGLSTRFDRMKSEALNNMNGKISIILVGNEPFVILDSGKKTDAEDIVNNLKQTASLSNIGNAILTASDLLKDKKGIIVVISDFITTEGLEADIARKTVEAKGGTVKFIDVKKGTANNVGIVDLQLEEDAVIATIENFNNKEESFAVKFNDNEEQQVKISPEVTTKVSFKPIPGINKISLTVDDDFALDNTAYISYPTIEEKRILLITNKEKSSLIPVLESYKSGWNNHVTVEVAQPPKLPIINHDIVILDGFDKSKVPSSVLENIEKSVSKGKTNLIITAQDDLKDTQVASIIPADFIGKGAETDVFNQLSMAEITTDVSFSKVNKYLKIKPKKGITLAATPGNESLILLSDYDNGLVLYYGIYDEESKFRYQVSYPVFWQQAIDYLLQKQSVSNLNYKIHEKLVFEDLLPIKTPTKDEKVGTLDFDEVGIYTIKNKQVAVNLLDKKESNINIANEALKTQVYALDQTESKEKLRILPYLVYAFLAILFIELLYIKIRGDL